MPTYLNSTSADLYSADPFAYVDTTQGVAGNRTLKFHVSSAFTNNRAYALQVTGTYEAA